VKIITSTMIKKNVSKKFLRMEFVKFILLIIKVKIKSVKAARKDLIYMMRL